jgi:signal transduction histidine kinase
VEVPAEVFEQYQRIRQFVGWTEADTDTVAHVRRLAAPALNTLIEDFFAAIANEPKTAHLLDGGPPQLDRLKVTVRQWLEDLLSGEYGHDYVVRRWRVGYRHVEVGLHPMYMNAALSRLRRGLIEHLEQAWEGTTTELANAIRCLVQLTDLDLAIIESAYQTEHARRQQRTARLAAVGQVAGGIAHELRGPLNIMKLTVGLLLKATGLSADQRAEHLERINQQVDLAAAVIRAVSDVARTPTPKFQPVSLENCLAEVLGNEVLPDNIERRLECPADLPPLRADADQLKIVISNLIRNARDAMPQGGKLLIAAVQEDRCVRIRVTDTGCGISEEDIARITEPLFTTKTRGLGLGLAMTKTILARHDSELQVRSRLGEGTEFAISFPVWKTD